MMTPNPSRTPGNFLYHFRATLTRTFLYSTLARSSEKTNGNFDLKSSGRAYSRSTGI